ncbi:hypothetical protein [Krasilnikovia sp. M28-CT-15]|uniref:hypothetical protein n=1 Tax=Krasilnikovia sp. M28-CT-15 TaxID=3373540 RepID=UPI00399C9627
MEVGRTAVTGRLARWLLLACTLFGLAAMHTLGHAGLNMEAHSGHAPVSVMTSGVMDGAGPVTWVTSVVDACPGCPPGSGHDGMSGWDVCLAVLTGFAALALLAVSLTGLWSDRAPVGTTWMPLRVPRGPPLGLGLVLAAGSVLRI